MASYSVVYKEICSQAASVEAKSPKDAIVMVRKWLEGIGSSRTPEAELTGVFTIDSEHMPDEPIEVYELDEHGYSYLSDKPVMSIAGVDSYKDYEPILEESNKEE